MRTNDIVMEFEQGPLDNIYRKKFEQMTKKELVRMLCGKAQFGGDYHAHCVGCVSAKTCEPWKLLHAIETGEREEPSEFVPRPKESLYLFSGTSNTISHKTTSLERVQEACDNIRKGMDPNEAAKKAGYASFDSFTTARCLLHVPDPCIEIRKEQKSKRREERLNRVKKVIADIAAGGDPTETAIAAGFESYRSFRSTCNYYKLPCPSLIAYGVQPGMCGSDAVHERSIRKVVKYLEAVQSGMNKNRAAVEAGFCDSEHARRSYVRNKEEIDRRMGMTKEERDGVVPEIFISKSNKQSHESSLQKVITYLKLCQTNLMTKKEAAIKAGYSDYAHARRAYARNKEEIDRMMAEGANVRA